MGMLRKLRTTDPNVARYMLVLVNATSIKCICMTLRERHPALIHRADGLHD